MDDNKGLEQEVYVFELDEVLFPKRDYLVQVFYLFGSFYAFTENSTSANDIALFMTKVYDLHGEEQVFLATKTMFNIDDKYEENYHRLKANAQIPLPLILYPDIDILFTKLRKKKKDIAILTKGNPVEQLNKLSFIDWGAHHDLKKTLKVYFKDELSFKSIEPIEFIASNYAVLPEQIILVDKKTQIEKVLKKFIY